MPRSAVLSVAVLAVALALAACAAEAPAPLPPRSLQAPIINGVYDPGHPQVVLLTWPSYRCTGTVISPRIVLTAAHCIFDGYGDALVPSQVFFGNDPSGPGTTLNATFAEYHPQYDPFVLSADIGIVVLEAPSPVEPLRVSYADLTFAAGTPMTIVGFGKQSPASTAPIGQKLMVTLPVAEVTDDVLRYQASVCGGDSGGPGLFVIDGRERVVGVTSYGDLCRSYGASQRVDLHRDWIEAQIARYEKITCERDFACATGCPQGDPDCPCSPTDGVCSAFCPDPDTDPDCPRGCGGGGECVTGPACPLPDPDCGDPCGPEGHCIHDCPFRDRDCPAAKPEGAACASDFDCGGGMLCGVLDGERVCARVCDPSRPACGEADCVPVTAGKGFCVDEARRKPGGCGVAGGGGSAGGAAWVMALGAWLLRRRRRHHR